MHLYKKLNHVNVPEPAAVGVCCCSDLLVDEGVELPELEVKVFVVVVVVVGVGVVADGTEVVRGRRVQIGREMVGAVEKRNKLSDMIKQLKTALWCNLSDTHQFFSHTKHFNVFLLIYLNAVCNQCVW